MLSFSKWLVKITHIRSSSSAKAEEETRQEQPKYKRNTERDAERFKQLATPFTDRGGKIHIEELCRTWFY